MDPLFNRKQFIAALIEVISTAISHNRLEDAESVLAGVRVLRPRMSELDTFEAWIAIKRAQWQDAIRILHKLDASSNNWGLGKALLAFCQFAIGDQAWSISANEVLEGNSDNREATALVKILMGKDDGPAEPEPAVQTSFADYDPRSAHASFLRA